MAAININASLNQNAANAAAERTIPKFTQPPRTNFFAGTPFQQRVLNAPPEPGELIASGQSARSPFTGLAALARAGIFPFQPGPINQQINLTPRETRPGNQQASTPSAPPQKVTSNQQTTSNNQQAAVAVPQASLPGPTSFIGQIPFFLNAVLSTPAGALPKGPLWIVVFNFDTNIKNTIKKVKEYEPRMPEPWEIDNALETVTTHRYQDEKGCMFAQTVTLPGESLIYTREGIQYNSFIRGGIGQGRQDFDSVRIGFLNTNVSFVDNVIRPWLVMTGHLGMVARPPEQKYRCNMTVYKLGIDRVDRPPFVAQQFNFWEVCPINVTNENLDYSGDGRTPIKEAEFAYQWYTTTSNKNTFAVAGIEASPTGGPDVRRAVPA